MSETKGSWKPSTAGGCFNKPSWRLNQQWSLRVDATATDFKLELSQQGSSFNIGVYLLKDTKDDVVPIYHDATEKLLHKSGFKPKPTVTIEVPKLEKGVYHIIPCTFEPGKEGKFVLKSSHGKLKRISMWEVTTWTGKWSGLSAGGCKNHKTFKDNPQYLFRLDGADASLATGVIFQQEHEEFNNLGFYVFKTEAPNTPVKLVQAKNIIGTAPFDDDCEVSFELPAALEPGNYSFIPCTFEPGQASAFTAYLFTSLPVIDGQGDGSAKPEPEAETAAPTKAAPSENDGEVMAKWQAELKAHQETLKQVSALQAQLREVKESNRELSEQVQALRRGGGVELPATKSVDSNLPRVLTTEPQTGTNVTINGCWQGESAGGCMNHPTWRNNPQLFLTVPSDQTKATFVFTQYPTAQGSLFKIGFYILHGSLSKGKRVFWLDNGDEDIVTKPKFGAAKISKIDMTLPSTPLKEPYIVIPCTFDPAQEQEWSLSLSTDSEVTLSPVPPGGAYHTSTCAGEWTTETAGGCKNHASFLDNPQYVLTIPEGTVESQARVLLTQSENSDFDAISVYVIKTQFSGKPHRLTKVDAADIIVKPKFSDPNETCISLPSVSGTFILIPCTFEPKHLAHFQLQVIASKPLKLDELGHGASASVSGEWRGKTAAGCLNDPISFKHNTQYRLSLKSEHTLIFKLSQQALADDSQAGVRSIGFYVFKTKSTGSKRKFKFPQDDQIAKSGFAKSKDLVGEHTLPAGEYVVVPCTFNAGEQAQYKLTILSKSNAPDFDQLCVFEPQSIPYVEHSADSEWTTDTAGGCLNTLSWINNPQFQISTDKHAEVTIFLSVPSLDTAEKIQAFSGIGFYLVPSHADSRVRLDMTPKEILKKASFRRSNEVALHTTLETGSYNIIPCTLKAGYLASFNVTVFTDNTTSFEFHNLTGSAQVLRGAWEDATAGGNTSNMEKWLTNPRYYISVKKSVKMTSLLFQKPELPAVIEGSSWKAVGFVVTNGDTEGMPRTSKATDLIAAAQFEAERDVTATFNLEPNIEPYVLIPSTFEAGQTGTYSLSFVFDPALKEFVTISTSPPAISDADLQEQLQAEVLVAKLQKCVATTATSANELGRLIKMAGLSALDSPSSQLNAVVRKLQALLNALKAPELYAKEVEAEAAKVAELSAEILPGPPPPPPPSGSAPKTASGSSSSTTAMGEVEAEEVYDGASKGLKPAKDRKLAPKTYSSPQEEMLAMIASGRAQLKNAADRKLKDKPVDKGDLFCAFANSFDQICARRRGVEGEDEAEGEDDDWD